MKKALIAALLTSLAMPVLAANAEAPDKNVDKTNDRGGPTGNDKTDALNKGQQALPPSPSQPSPVLTTPQAGSPPAVPEQMGTPVTK